MRRRSLQSISPRPKGREIVSDLLRNEAIEVTKISTPDLSSTDPTMVKEISDVEGDPLLSSSTVSDEMSLLRAAARGEMAAAASEDTKSEINSKKREVPWWATFMKFTLFYFVIWMLGIVFCSLATGVQVILNLFAKIILIDYILELPKSCKKREILKFGFWYGFFLSLFIYRNASMLSTGIHLIKPCREFETIVHDLKFATNFSHIPLNDYMGSRRPMQAMGLGNEYMKELASALTIHLDRYGRSETLPAPYIEQLNLIGNVFDDTGLIALIDALDHPHSYTTDLLIGRNTQITDKGVMRIAQLIESPSFSTSDSSLSKDLIWLETGGTSMSSRGLTSLYRAMGKRYFKFLGTEYTDSWSLGYVPYFHKWNPIPSSLLELHHAKHLTEIAYTGNTLSDSDMPLLTEAVMNDSNITRLVLVNNYIGNEGVKALLPLVTKLTDLNLGLNSRIDDDGAILLAEALKSPNATVENLSLFNCRIGRRGAEAFLSIFPDNKRLKYLSVGNETIPKETLEALHTAVTANWK